MVSSSNSVSSSSSIRNTAGGGSFKFAVESVGTVGGTAEVEISDIEVNDAANEANVPVIEPDGP